MKQIIKKNSLVLIILILGLAACTSDSISSDYNQKEFTLLIATSNHGEVGPCGWKSNPLGGLARKQTILKESAETEATYFVDAGDVFFKTTFMPKAKQAELVAIAEVIVEAYNLMDCKVMNVGANDLAAGSDVIQNLQSKANFPFISANISLKDQAELIYEPSTIVEAPGLKLGFVGVTTGDKRLKEYTFNDPVEAAKQAVADLKGKVDLIFLLANVSNEVEASLTQEVGDIDFLIRSKSRMLYRVPKVQDGVVLIHNSVQGKYAGMLRVKRLDEMADLTDVSKQQARIKFAEIRLTSMAKTLKEGVTLEEHYAGDKNRLLLISRLQDEKAKNEAQVIGFKNSYYFEAIPLNEKVPDDPEVFAIVEPFILEDS